MIQTSPATYRGRIAPSPTGYLHLGHARTFAIAAERAAHQQGTLILRSEDLDHARVRPEFTQAMLEDLHWFGIQWQEGPDRGGPSGPYLQSERLHLYQKAWDQLRASGSIYPCYCTRRDIQQAIQAPHAGDEEALYPGTCRPHQTAIQEQSAPAPSPNRNPAWRFKVREGEAISFVDGALGPQCFVAGEHLGDFVVWRNDGTPSYQLAVVVDDLAMQITEVVRGEDLLLSTARQLLLYRALGKTPPQFYHCDLVRDATGQRLAKRCDSMSLRALRASGVTAEELRTRLLKTEGKSWV